jgi:hypothetical protein
VTSRVNVLRKVKADDTKGSRIVSPYENWYEEVPFTTVWPSCDVVVAQEYVGNGYMPIQDL